MGTLLLSTFKFVCLSSSPPLSLHVPSKTTPKLCFPPHSSPIHTHLRFLHQSTTIIPSIHTPNPNQTKPRTPKSNPAMLTFLTLLLCFSAAQSTDFFYDGFTAAAADKSVNLYGTATVISKGIIQLTNTTSRLTAHLFYNSKIPFKDPQNGAVRSFSTAFTFAMVPEFQKLGGHGMAFTISPTKDLSSALPSQYLGLFNASDNGNSTNHIFAVEFDSVRDFEFGDIDDNHVGIDLNSLTSNYSISAAYFTENGTKVNITLKSENTIQAWIDFDSASSFLNVTLSPFGSKPKTPLMSHKINLSSIFQDDMYVGFSCATGLLASSHYLLGWSFNMSGSARALSMTKVPMPSSSKSRMALAIGLSVSFSGILIAGTIIGLYVYKRTRDDDVIEAWEKTIGPHRYSYKELKVATKGFREKELLGRGGFGRVYRGVLPKTKTLVAVKRVSHESRQGLKEFVAEIATIGRVRHRNLVQLLGWCRRRGDLLLVYDYMPNGSLDKYLFDQPVMVLSWEQRFKIIKGVASGLIYLHEGWDQVVIHRDIKSSNVLLDSELNGRLGDFGLARLHDHGAYLTTTRVVGTLGYLAPELAKTGKSTTATDVYSFGTLLLEVVCGRRPIEPKAPQDELVLVEWVWDKWIEGKITNVVDPRLGGKFDEEEVMMVLKLGLMCSCDASMVRPTMRHVVSFLTGEMEMPEVLIPPSGVENMEGSKGFLHSFQSSTFDAISSSSWSKGEMSTEHNTGSTPLVIL